MADFSSLMSGVESAVARANAISNANSARAAEEARIQREWQEQQNAKAMQFNASEAAKSRDWQEYMSNTAHQREIADLKAAGLNPVLSAMGGNGAAVTSGATASGVTSVGAKGDVDTSANQAITNLLGSMLNYMSNLQATSTSAIASMANAQTAAEVQELIALISERSAWNIQQSKEGHDVHMASKYPQTLPGYAGAARDILKDGADWFVKSAAPTIGDAASSAGSWLKKVFVDESSFKKFYNALNEKTRDKFAKGYYSSKR